MSRHDELPSVPRSRSFINVASRQRFLSHQQRPRALTHGISVGAHRLAHCDGRQPLRGLDRSPIQNRVEPRRSLLRPPRPQRRARSVSPARERCCCRSQDETRSKRGKQSRGAAGTSPQVWMASVGGAARSDVLGFVLTAVGDSKQRSARAEPPRGTLGPGRAVGAALMVAGIFALESQMIHPIQYVREQTLSRIGTSSIERTKRSISDGFPPPKRPLMLPAVLSTTARMFMASARDHSPIQSRKIRSPGSMRFG